MKLAKTLFLSTLLATTSFYASANTLEEQFDQGVVAYEQGNYHKAYELWLPLAEQGIAEVQFNLGKMYANGEGVKQDDTQAVKWYQKAAEQGLAQAQVNLGNMYYDGRGVKQDYHQAVKWYQKAAEQGDAAAQNNLATMYANGKGVEQDYEKAFYWWEKALVNSNEFVEGNIIKNLSELQFAHWKACQQKGGDVCQAYERLKKWGK